MNLFTYFVLRVMILLSSSMIHSQGDETFEKRDEGDSMVSDEEFGDVEVIFPGCGSRYPKIGMDDPGTTSNSNNKKRSSLRRETPDRFLDRRKRYSLDMGEAKIVGGVEAKKNSWPWMAALFINDEFVSGATLISKQYALTAAHTFFNDMNPKTFKIMVRGHNISEDGDGEWPEIEKILVHADYQNGEYYYDIAIIKFKAPLELNSKVFPVCLPSFSLRNKLVHKRNVTVTGWGALHEDGRKAADVLQEVNLPIVSVRKCNALVGSGIGESEINSSFICAGFDEGGKDACIGDSGGALVTEMNDANYVQLGIVSYGDGCARPGIPGVYLRVSKFTKWIRDNTDLGENKLNATLFHSKLIYLNHEIN